MSEYDEDEWRQREERMMAELLAEGERAKRSKEIMSGHEISKEDEIYFLGHA